MSFAGYASQFLARQQQQRAGTSSLSQSSSQPMFFSFTTDDNPHMDDEDDPHLRRSKESEEYDEDDDPYLRLDEEEEDQGLSSRYAARTDLSQVPLIGSEEEEPEPRGGWLAHQAVPGLRSASPSTPSSTSSSSPPSPPLFTPPPPPRTNIDQHISLSHSLTESLLPRGSSSHPPFSLPDPRFLPPRNRRKYNDPVWTSVFLSLVTVCLVAAFVLLFVTHKPDKKRWPKPYTTLLHTLPLLTILTLAAALLSYAHIFLLRLFLRPAMMAGRILVPTMWLVCAVWSFIGSFMWEEGVEEPTWGETVGLRLFSLIPLTLSLLSFYRLFLVLSHSSHPNLLTRLSSSPEYAYETQQITQLTLSTSLLLSHPLLMALSPALLLAMLVLSIPFGTLVARLLLVGRFDTGTSTVEWHIRPYAHWCIFLALAVWFWAWGVARGILRVTAAGVVGAWYFADEENVPPTNPTQTIHAALIRATGPSLGTTILFGLVSSSLRLLSLCTLLLSLLLQVLPRYLILLLPFPLQGIAAWPLIVLLGGAIASLIARLEGVAEQWGGAPARSTVAFLLGRRGSGGGGGYGLVYTGLTGEAWGVSVRRAKGLSTLASRDDEGDGGGRHRRRGGNALRGPDLPLPLPLTLPLPCALATYLFVAHTLQAPEEALGAALLAGGVTALVGAFCKGLVGDVADTLFMCYCIDRDMGTRREGREDVVGMFDLDPSHTQPRQRHDEENPRPPQPPHTNDRRQRHTPLAHEESEPEASYLEDNSQLLVPLRASPPASRAPAPPEASLRRSSAEANRKSPVYEPEPASDEEGEEGEGSGVFPGSGFF